MCGIVGVFHSDQSRPVDPAHISRMCGAIVHRGPDDEGSFVAASVGLGMRRLSIIDLETGHQPISNEDGSLTIVFNGEIYNHLDIRRDLIQRGHRFQTASDTECIVHAYEEYGADCLRLLNGMFAFAIWDARKQELFIARDRLGIKPLYLYESPGQIAFASEIKAILTDPTVPKDLDWEAVTYFFRYGYVSAPATLLKSVRQLPPAHYLRVTRTGSTCEKYWSLSHEVPDPVSEEEHAARIFEGLKAAVRRQLISDVPLGAFLSGGLDSSSIVKLMSEVSGNRVRTYAIGFGSDDRFHDELADARFVANRCGTDHHEIVVTPDVATLLPRLVDHLDQPLSDSSFIVTYLVSQLARDSVKVILSGVGGDELFGGYRRYLGPTLDRFYDRVPQGVRGVVTAVAKQLPVDRGSPLKNYARLARSFVTSHGLPAFERYDQTVRLVSDDVLQQLLVSEAEDTCLRDLRKGYFADAPAGDTLASMMALDRQTSLSDSLLLLTDKMTMATSLEARVPFLDHEFVDLAARIPSNLKVNGTRLRYIQKRSMEGQLPTEVLGKKKRGFGCPIGAWFRGQLKPLLLDTLSSETVRQRGIFEPAVVARTIADHMEQRQDYSELLLSLLTFELWYSRSVVRT